MFRIAFCSIALIFSFVVYAQEDVKTIQQHIAAKGGYELLKGRFISSDTSLSIADFKLIYYGFLFEPAYRPLETAFKENLIKPYNRAGKYAEAIQIADSILLQNPVSITAHFEKAFSCAKSGKPELETYHRKRYIVLCNVIKSSGNGSEQLPFIALSVNDALELLSYLGLQAVNDRQIENGLIEFDLARNKAKLVHVYFSIPAQAYTPPDMPESD